MIITEPSSPSPPEETGEGEEASEESESFTTSAVSSLPEENSAEKTAAEDVSSEKADDTKGQRPKEQRPQDDVFARKAEERRRMLQSLMEENKSVLTNIVASEIKKRQESIDSGGEISAARDAIQQTCLSFCLNLQFHNTEVVPGVVCRLFLKPKS